MTKKLILVSVLASAAALCQKVDPKGIFVSGGGSGSGTSGGHPSVKYSIKLERNGEPRAVATSYRFQDHDRFRFLFEVNQPYYVYLLHRQLEGDPDGMERYTGAKGITVVREGDSRAPQASGSFTLLYPTKGSVRLSGRQPQTIPANGEYFQLDTKSGIEKIVMVVSPYEIDMSRFTRTPAPSGGGNGNGNGSRNDSNGDVMGQLSKEIAEMDRNSVSVSDEPSAKGICVGDCNGYTAPRNPGKPFLVNIDLRHYRSN